MCIEMNQMPPDLGSEAREKHREVSLRNWELATAVGS